MNLLEYRWKKQSFESEKQKLEKQIHQLDELIQMKNQTEALRDILKQREIQLQSPSQPKQKKPEEKKSTTRIITSPNLTKPKEQPQEESQIKDLEEIEGI